MRTLVAFVLLISPAAAAPVLLAELTHGAGGEQSGDSSIPFEFRLTNGADTFELDDSFPRWSPFPPLATHPGEPPTPGTSTRSVTIDSPENIANIESLLSSPGTVIFFRSSTPGFPSDLTSLVAIEDLFAPPNIPDRWSADLFVPSLGIGLAGYALDFVEYMTEVRYVTGLSTHTYGTTQTFSVYGHEIPEPMTLLLFFLFVPVIYARPNRLG
jgi:hypothetical protein